MTALDCTRRHQIEHRAYDIWQAEGKPEGCALDHWLKAEGESNAPDAPSQIAGSPREKVRTRKRKSPIS